VKTDNKDAVMIGSIWSAESEARLKEMWSKGFTGSQIAAELGRTRNAVIGKVNRLGISDQKGFFTPSGPKPLSLKPRNIRARELRAARKAGVAPPPIETTVKKVKRVEALKTEVRVEALKKITPDFSFPESRRVSIIELRNIHCRFPLGDPAVDGFCYCGADRESLGPFQPYCAGHAAIAYRQAPALKVRAYR
jgi:GcrA cell cycle regulator